LFLSSPTRDDEGAAQDRRVQIVEMIRSGQLANRDELDRILLPDDLASASIGGDVTVRNQPFMVFFTTWVTMSPDPYCGYEFAPDTGSLDPDPEGSGQGREQEAIGDSWYWICAS